MEVLLLVTVGAVRARTILGPRFYAAHVALFFLGTPALANILVLRKGAGLLSRWYTAVPLCTGFALVLVLLQYGVSEALYGIDGDNGPFSWSRPRAMDQDSVFRTRADAARQTEGLTAAFGENAANDSLCGAGVVGA